MRVRQLLEVTTLRSAAQTDVLSLYKKHQISRNSCVCGGMNFPVTDGNPPGTGPPTIIREKREKCGIGLVRTFTDKSLL